MPSLRESICSEGEQRNTVISFISEFFSEGMEVISSVSKWGRLKRWDDKKKKKGFVWEDVLMSRKWGGMKGDWGTRQKCRKLQLRE